MRRAAAAILARVDDGRAGSWPRRRRSRPARPHEPWRVRRLSPTTAPARADPAFVTDFNERLVDAVRDGKAEFVEVIARLRERGALAGEPKLISEGRGATRRDIYHVPLGYSWDYGSYTFTVDQAGKIYQFDFGPAQFLSTLKQPPSSSSFDCSSMR
jgi:hypothetical protein